MSSDVGRDEDSALALVRRLEATQRELTGFDATIGKLEKTASGLMVSLQILISSIQTERHSWVTMRHYCITPFLDSAHTFN